MNKNTEYSLRSKLIFILIVTVIPITVLSVTAFMSMLGQMTYAQDFENITIDTIPVADNIYMLAGQGGNIGVSVGDDGVFLIDDQFAPLVDKILNAIKDISDKPVKFVINTHYHRDHVGGNEALGKNGSIIVSHNNTRERISTEQFNSFSNRTIDPISEEGLPIITFADSITFHFNGDKINIRHIPAAHTDGDIIVHFTNSNVIHTGDLVSSSGYPLIDIASGGSIDGIIDGIESTILPLADNDTKIITGHSDLTTLNELIPYLHMMNDIRNQISEMIQQGRTLDEVKSANTTANYDEKYGQGFIDSERFTELVYNSLSS